MRQNMIRWGAVELECPSCHQKTPVYPTTILGGGAFTHCLNCDESLQYKDGQAVIAEVGTASAEEIKAAEAASLDSIANIAHYSLGIPRKELNPTLQARLPEEGKKHGLAGNSLFVICICSMLIGIFIGMLIVGISLW